MKSKKIVLLNFFILFLFLCILVFPSGTKIGVIDDHTFIFNDGKAICYLTEPERYTFGESPIEQEMIRQIDKATTSIKLSIFDFDNSNILNSLINANNRGVKVEIICDIKNTPSKIVYIFQKMGWLINYRSKNLMHHKIIIFDDCCVGLGSMNFTVSCMYANNNDFFFFYEKEIVEVFLKYFEYLKSNKYRDFFNSPIKLSGFTFLFTNSTYDVNNIIADLILKCQYRIIFAYSTFTNGSIASLILDCVKNKNLFFLGILEKRNALTKYSIYQYFLDNNMHIYLDRNDYYMHHKMMVLDDTVLTGSYAISTKSLSNPSNNFNDEVLFYFKDDAFADFICDYIKSLLIN